MKLDCFAPRKLFCCTEKVASEFGRILCFEANEVLYLAPTGVTAFLHDNRSALKNPRVRPIRVEELRTCERHSNAMVSVFQVTLAYSLSIGFVPSSVDVPLFEARMGFDVFSPNVDELNPGICCQSARSKFRGPCTRADEDGGLIIEGRAFLAKSRALSYPKGPSRPARG